MTAPWKKGRTYYARIPRSTGPAVAMALGTRYAPVRDAKVAAAIGTMCDTMVQQGQWAALDAMAAGRVPPVTMLAAWRAHDVPGLLARLDDVDVATLVPAWPAVSPRARQQVVRLMGDGWPRSAFTTAEVSRRLSALAVGQPNRYRAALSAFVKWAVQMGHLATNPVRDAVRAKEAPPQVRALDDVDTRRVLAAITDPEHRARAALMVATGLELQATDRLTHRDVRGREIDAKGTKALHRTRTVVVLFPELAEAWAAWYRRGLPDARVFRGGRRAFQRAVTAAAEAVGLTMRPAHDWRHTFAVRALRAGVPLYAVAHQLGHGSTLLAQKVYGRFVPQVADLAATVPATVLPPADATRTA